jgi:hypothetical protein
MATISPTNAPEIHGAGVSAAEDEAVVEERTPRHA